MTDDKMYTKDEVEQLLAVNDSSSSDNGLGMRQRMAAIMSGGYDFADTLHNVYLDYGYPARTEFFHYWNMYRRFGVARRVITIFPDLGWMYPPTIVAQENVLADLDIIVKRLKLWNRLKGLDTRQRVGRYAGLFMRVRDSKSPEQPLEGVLPGQLALVDVIPMYESQLEVIDTQNDPTADDYGMPTMYQFKGGDVGNRNEKSVNTFNIHPSRVIIAAEDSDNGGIYGISALESIYNSLMDLRKIIGAGGEGFYKNAAQSIVFDLKDPASAKANATLLNKFNENFDDFQRNRARRSMWTPGMEAQVLSSTLAAPKEHFDNALADISAGSGIPSKFLIGTQTGVLAGDSDGEALLTTVQSRKGTFQSEMVSNVLNWCMQYGILPTSDFEIEWDDALAPSDKEKLENADKMADINTKLFNAGQSPCFTEEQVAVAAGFELDELEIDELPDETLPDETLPDETLPEDVPPEGAPPNVE